MPASRVLNGVLHNFLGTLLSRYSDFGGYWIYGFVVVTLTEAAIDLLKPEKANDTDPVSVFTSLARSRFLEQLGKSGLPRDRVKTAVLAWRRSDLTTVPSVWGPRNGYRITLEVTTTIGSGKRFQRSTSESVLVHNPSLERRSGRVA